ncbi:MAG: ribbon-helix-helix domain-containing protein [Candidatus Aenigmatarchaeota archaeon]
MTKRTNIKIPKNLYDRVQELIDDTGFNSVTEFIKFVLRDIVAQGKFEGPEELNEDMEIVRKRLEKLGYLDRE